MYYETFDISDPQAPALLERTYYEYSGDAEAGRQGSPTTIVWETPQPSGPAAFRAIDLQYNNGGELWFAIRRHWSGTEGCEEVIDGITEFRGGGRARRLVRQRSVESQFLVVPDSTRWTDFDGDEAYADYAMTLDPQTGVVSPVPTAAYLPGVGQMDVQTGWVSYTHGDQIGSLRAVSAVGGSPSERQTRQLVYTSFGEKVYDEGSGSALPPEDTRYQYAGAWGYESDADQGLPFLHVGYRYYDPSTGRFLQRDPIGIAGGLNVYEYVESMPTDVVDPLGLSSLMRPDAIVHLINAECCLGGGVLVKWGPNVYRVVSTIEQKIGNRTVVQLVTDTGKILEVAWTGQGPLMNVTQTSTRAIIVAPPSGVCGVTGLEPLPLFLLFLWFRRRSR